VRKIGSEFPNDWENLRQMAANFQLASMGANNMSMSANNMNYKNMGNMANHFLIAASSVPAFFKTEYGN
jgi:hypothetical protein